MPLMISRLILSLNKTARAPNVTWGVGQVSNISFARRTIGGIEHGGDAIPLKSFVGGSESVSDL